MYLRSSLEVNDSAYRYRIQRFLTANGVDPHDVAASPRLVIAGRHILYTEFITRRRRYGKTLTKLRVVGVNGYAKRKRKARIIVPWKDCA